MEGEEAWLHGHQLKLCSSHALTSFQSNGENIQYKIPVVTTKCNYGGERHWFICPLPSCRRRSKKLYLHSQGIFICRKCLNIAYSTQNRSKLDRIIDKKWSLIRKCGEDSEWTQKKPKGMHQKTFDRIQNEICRLDELATQNIAAMFGRFPGM